MRTAFETWIRVPLIFVVGTACSEPTDRVAPYADSILGLPIDTSRTAFLTRSGDYPRRVRGFGRSGSGDPSAVAHSTALQCLGDLFSWDDTPLDAKRRVAKNVQEHNPGFRFIDMVGTRSVDGVERHLAVFRHELTSLEFVAIPGIAPGKHSNSRMEHPAGVRPYFFARTELTRSAVAATMHSSVEQDAGDSELPSTGQSAGWIGDFCARTGLDVPDPRQWEHAARAGTTQDTLWGDCGDPAAWANVGATRIQPVGRLKQNAFGLYDIIGNAWELTRDRDERGQPWVLRGSSYTNDASRATFSARVRLGDGLEHAHVGFRPVRIIR